MSEMNELFYRDPYCRSFMAEVIRCEKGKKGYEVLLSDTAFYPEGGGQPGDTGTLNGIRVLDTRKRGDEIIHITEAPAEGIVKGEIDWDRRFDLMQNHTGEHILSGLIHQKYGYDNVGFHMGDMIQIDFDGMIPAEDLAELEMMANRIIWNDVPVNILFPGEEELKDLPYRSKKELEGLVRIVEIPGADICACCGTHVRRSGEVGMIRIFSSEKHKNGVRLEILSGRRALQLSQKLHEQNSRISVMLAAEPVNTASHVERQKEEIVKRDGQLSRIRQKYITMKADGIQPERLQILFEEDTDRVMMRKYVNLLIESKKAETAAVLTESIQGFDYVIGSVSDDLRKKAKTLNQRLSGRGGGSTEMIQGTFSASKEDIESVLREEL